MEGLGPPIHRRGSPRSSTARRGSPILRSGLRNAAKRRRSAARAQTACGSGRSARSSRRSTMSLVRYFDEALALSRAATDRVTEARALFGLARTLRSARTISTRRAAHIERALSVAESLRTGVENRDLRASYVASVYGVLRAPGRRPCAIEHVASRQRVLGQSVRSQRTGTRTLAAREPDRVRRRPAGRPRPRPAPAGATAKLAFDNWARAQQAIERGRNAQG